MSSFDACRRLLQRLNGTMAKHVSLDCGAMDHEDDDILLEA